MTASREVSIKLAKYGIKLDTEKVWADEGINGMLRNKDQCPSWLYYVPAPSMSEVWKELPEEWVDNPWYGGNLFLTKKGNLTRTTYSFVDYDSLEYEEENPTDALVNLLIYVKTRDERAL